MLISKGITVGEIVTIKTTAGEEIVAKLIEDGTNNVTVAKPLCLTATKDGIGLVPFLFTTDSSTEITINKTAIMVLAPTMKDAADTYIQQTTGIKLATA
jgi:hypothetical protein